MRPDLNQIEREIAPLLEVHGVELVALEWFQGPGHGILRITVDRPGGDPRVQDPALSVGLEELTNVTRDVSSAMDALDLIASAYTLEIGSPGPERPVQKQADFDRFAGFAAKLDAREPGGGKSTFKGVLRGTTELPGGSFAVKLEVAGKVFELPAARVSRARLLEIKAPPKDKPGKGPSKRQERLAARQQAREINAAHQAARAAATVRTTGEAEGIPAGPSPARAESDTTSSEADDHSPAAPRAPEAKR
jgi:ribosome maturation factor RimP